MTSGSLLPDILRLHGPDCVFAYPVCDPPDRETTITEANDAAFSLLGYSREELLALSPADIIPGFPALTGNDFGPFETDDRLIEHALTTRSGVPVPVEIKSHVISVGGRAMNVVAARDISGRIRSRRLEIQDEKCFSAIFGLSRKFDEPEEAILAYALEQVRDMTASQLGYVYFLDAAETGMTLRAWSADPALNQNDPPPGTCLVSESGLFGAPVRQRGPIIVNSVPEDAAGPDHPGMPIPVVRYMGVPIIDNGRMVLVAGLANKEGDYTKTDMAHFSLPMENAWRIIQRKRMEEEMVEAVKSAKKASRSKSQFLANMSHELRTPLNGIMGMTQLLLGTEINNEQKEYLTLSMEAALHLSKVMTSLLDLSSIETGAITVTPVNFNLPDTLESLIKPLALQAAGKSVTLGHEIAPNVPALINGDEKKLRQILINLIYNAIKFTEQGEVALSVTRTAATSGLLGDMAELRFTVTDTGIGIPEDKLDSIFESFVLGEDYLTKRYGGTGLGLSISRELATIMGGDITAKSTPGRGSAFTLTLPFLLRDAKGGSCAIVDPPCGPTRPLRILVAEDERVNALVTSGMLKKRGHTVTVVGNGQHAVDALIEAPYDLVLMDVQMPVINGLEVTEIIRRGAAENVPRDIPIIGLTAYATDADSRRCLEAGMDSVVTKPFAAEELLAAICRTVAD
ncbi:MAG: response regulator [Desulfovibrionaceae bacterium]|nr:response regulator [Desulfovibrionaceae bacterium]